jgi:hypothetical protein
MPKDEIRLFCWVQGDDFQSVFPVDINLGDSVGHLKKAIRVEKPSFKNVAADSLRLSKVDRELSYVLVHISDSCSVQSVLRQLDRGFYSSYRYQQRAVAIEVVDAYSGHMASSACAERAKCHLTTSQ